uniref:Uncharacterized protein n=1 Tax=Arundo donax TaxID=35708 RepID=A0A0A8YTI7_ARUDO
MWRDKRKQIMHANCSSMLVSFWSPLYVLHNSERIQEIRVDQEFKKHSLVCYICAWKKSRTKFAFLLSLQDLGWGPPTAQDGRLAQQVRMGHTLCLVAVNNNEISQDVKGFIISVCVELGVKCGWPPY